MWLGFYFFYLYVVTFTIFLAVGWRHYHLCVSGKDSVIRRAFYGPILALYATEKLQIAQHYEAV